MIYTLQKKDNQDIEWTFVGVAKSVEFLESIGSKYKLPNNSIRIIDEIGEVVVPTITKPARFYSRKGQVGILIHDSYGVGYSSEGVDQTLKEFLLFSPDLITARYNGESLEKAKEIVKNAGFDPDCTTLKYCWDELNIEYVKDGQKFFVDEYNGFESIVKLDDVEWMTA